MNRKFFYRGVCSCLMLLFANVSLATHIMGGEITWRCTPSGAYIFQLKVYRDCQGITTPGSAILRAYNYPTTGSQVTFPMTRVAQNDISPDCNLSNSPGSTELSCGTFGGAQGNGDGAVEESIYETAPITLNGTPPANGWVFTWSSCCRSNSIDNLVAPGGTGHTLRAIMYPYTAVGTSGPMAANPCYDNSPVFEGNANTVICTNYPVSYNHYASDPDLDSLYYSWASPLDDGVSGWNPPISPPSVMWLSGYSNSSPFPGLAQHPMNVPASLDNISGQITFTSFTAGSFVSCVKVEAWRSGQLIAEVFRDMQTSMLSCSNTNTPPNLLVTVDSASAPISVNGNLLSATVSPGDLIAFSLNGSDFDLQPISFAPQEVEFSATGVNLAPINNPSAGCPYPPCATITPTPGQSTFINPTINQVDFSWQTDINHLFAQMANGTFESRYTFGLRMEDDFCPVPAAALATLLVTVKILPPKPPVLNSVAYDSSGAVQINWTAPADTGSQFNHYAIHHRPPGGVFAVVDSTKDYAIGSALLSGLPAGGEGDYYMTTNGIFGVNSAPSDTLSLGGLNVADAMASLAISVFPNPVGEQLIIRAPISAQIVLIDLSGKVLIATRTAASESRWDTRAWPKGMYLLKIYSDALWETRKIVKE